jgi:hypothetical protein
MGCDSIGNRGKQCVDTLGGIDLIYVFPFVKYAKSLIVRNGLELTTYPDTFVYSLAIVSGEYTDSAEIGDGGEFVNQSLTVGMTRLIKTDEFRKLLKQDYGVIAKDNEGNFRLMGVYNGAKLETYTATTGADYSAFNGYNLNFTAKEQDEALYFDDLEGVGFTPVGSGESGNNFIFQDGNNFVFQDNNNFIFN